MRRAQKVVNAIVTSVLHCDMVIGAVHSQLGVENATLLCAISAFHSRSATSLFLCHWCTADATVNHEELPLSSNDINICCGASRSYRP
jgi:hypothetical protein